MQINEDIRDREVRVVTDGGEQLGIMSVFYAVMANPAGLANIGI